MAIVEKALTGDLLAGVNPTGGWGYSTGKASRIEPTSWALLALSSNSEPNENLETHRRFLTSRQLESGLLADDESSAASVASNGLAAIAMLQHRDAVPETAIQALLNALVTLAGPSQDAADAIAGNDDLASWPWVDGDMSWVEPTSWAMLALKTARAKGLAPLGADDRIAEAERHLLARCFKGGGWNRGHTNRRGRDAEPYPSVTALVLVAMQDRRNEPAIVRSLEYLQRHWEREESAIGLALVAVCFRRYGIDTSAVEHKLLERLPTAQMLGYLHALAVCLHALDERTKGAALAF